MIFLLVLVNFLPKSKRENFFLKTKTKYILKFPKKNKNKNKKLKLNKFSINCRLSDYFFSLDIKVKREKVEIKRRNRYSI